MSPRVPRVSVVIPVYNAERFLAETLDSVCASTLRDIEVICVDDGSTDASLEIIGQNQASDPRIKLITQDHLYAGAARNAGIEAATGTYIHFMDADDLIDKQAYASWVKIADALGAQVVECRHYNVDAETGAVVSKSLHNGKGMNTGVVPMSLREHPYALTHGNVVPWNKLYLREFLIDSNIRFDDLICAEDRSFYFDLIFRVERYIRVDSRWVSHRVNIGTSLDGSSVRSRHFDVEFRSFERIWEYAADQPDDVKLMVLDACIGDSVHYYKHTIGTQYEQSAGDQLCAYWRDYLPLFEESDVVKRRWHRTYVEALAARLPEEEGEQLLKKYEPVFSENERRHRRSQRVKKVRSVAAKATLPLRWLWNRAKYPQKLR